MGDGVAAALELRGVLLHPYLTALGRAEGSPLLLTLSTHHGACCTASSAGGQSHNWSHGGMDANRGEARQGTDCQQLALLLVPQCLGRRDAAGLPGREPRHGQHHAGRDGQDRADEHPRNHKAAPAGPTPSLRKRL